GRPEPAGPQHGFAGGSPTEAGEPRTGAETGERTADAAVRRRTDPAGGAQSGSERGRGDARARVRQGDGGDGGRSGRAIGGAERQRRRGRNSGGDPAAD